MEKRTRKFKRFGRVKLPRYIGNGISDENVKYELHCFSDASINAYAAVVHLRIISYNKITTTFLMAKSRIATMDEKNDLKIKRDNEDELTIHNSGDSHDDFETKCEVEKLTSTIIKKLQRKYFQDEVSGKETSLARNLGLFLDENQILRSKSRMAYANWSYDKRFPILLLKNSLITMRLIQKTHEDNYHVGTSHTLNILRDKYWIPSRAS